MWADEAALDEATRRLDGWEASIANRAAQAKELASRVQAMRGTATSADRTIQVTVDASGLLVDLRLDERTRQHSATHTARQILDTTRAAHADLLNRITEATTAILDDEDPTAAALVESYRRRLDPDRDTPDARR
ncbi:YbaB/EbfC family nucleoid-associated protein [Micromonospora sp. CPCC 205546]|uniref:YbaB/EbfC family nucleoid-associated protein n=1 Tax=Micromonospora sp. CPCC 205546 TaxID=3122397 RepID=UPI002FF18E78